MTAIHIKRQNWDTDTQRKKTTCLSAQFLTQKLDIYLLIIWLGRRGENSHEDAGGSLVNKGNVIAPPVFIFWWYVRPTAFMIAEKGKQANERRHNRLN